jgi:hypothetical protein
MPEQLKWSYSVQAVRGPTISGNGILEVDAYLKLNVTVPAVGSLDVEVLPDGGGSVQLLVINPAKPSKDLTYIVDAVNVPLDGPHVLIGAGAVSLLAATIGTLKFENAGAEDAEISILAGREATP